MYMNLTFAAALRTALAMFGKLDVQDFWTYICMYVCIWKYICMNMSMYIDIDMHTYIDIWICVRDLHISYSNHDNHLPAVQLYLLYSNHQLDLLKNRANDLYSEHTKVNSKGPTRLRTSSRGAPTARGRQCKTSKKDERRARAEHRGR